MVQIWQNGPKQRSLDSTKQLACYAFTKSADHYISISNPLTICGFASHHKSDLMCTTSYSATNQEMSFWKCKTGIELLLLIEINSLM